MRVTFLCERLHCLPNVGGLFQQDEKHLQMIEKVLLASDEYQKKLSEKPPTKKPDESI